MSEHPGDNQEPEGDRKGRAARVIFAALVTVLLSGILSWVFVPAVRVLGYQTILIIGPVSAREWSVEKLEGYKELAVEPLIMALKDKEWDVRTMAAYALGNIGPKAEKAVPALIETLKDKEQQVRDNAAWALGKIGPKAEKAVPALIEALKDKNEYVRKAAKEALEKIQKK
jgi:vesicle coat complex subunit